MSRFESSELFGLSFIGALDGEGSRLRLGKLIAKVFEHGNRCVLRRARLAALDVYTVP
jgi:hypothetical protein